MLKAGLLPSPTINALSSNPAASKNKIDTQTFVEIRSEIPNVKIYFSVDGTKPDPFQIFRTGHVSTFMYRGAFRLGPGRRTVKAIAVTSDGLRESHVVTKYYDVNDLYGENYPPYLDDNSDQEQFFDQPEYEQPPPTNTKKKPRTNPDHRRSNSANQPRQPWDDSFQLTGSVEGPISPVNYAGTQINIWGIPGGNLTEGLLNVADPSRNPNFGYMTEEMIKRVQPAIPAPPRIVDVTDEKNFWDRKLKPFSPGDGDWEKTLDHLFLQIYHFVKEEPELQELFGWKKFGRIEKAQLVDKGGNYQILTTFKKPLGEQRQPISDRAPPTRKPSSRPRPQKRPRTPPIEMPDPSIHEVTPPPTPPRRQPPPATTSEPKDETVNETHTPRIYTEETVQQGTLIPFRDFNVDRDCENLQKAMKGLGTDEEMLIHILGNRSSDQRVQIRDKYKVMFGKDLADDIKGDTSGNFCKVLKNLLYSPVEYDCRELRRAIRGAGTDEEALIEILASRSKKRLQEITNLYSTLFNRPLEKDISGDTSGHLKKILLSLLHGERPDTNEVNEDEAENDARTLYEAGEKKWGTDESKFVEILSTRSNAQLKAIFDAYGNHSKKDIEAAIKSETSGNICRAFLAIVRVMRSRPTYFAYQLKKALKGMGTDEDELNRVVISRCEVDMIQIKEEYESLMKRSLEKHISSDTSGDYKKILLELIKDPSQRTSKAGKAKYEDVELPGYKQPEIYNEEVIQQGTMIAAPNFDANRDADALRKAMKGLGTDEKTIISILGNRNTKQRLEIKAAFKNKHNRDLVADLKSETSGNFCKLLERLMMDPVELDCFELKTAVKGLGTDEEPLIEILASRSNERIRAINEAYPKMYSKSLEQDIKSDTSGDFRRLLVSLLQGKRPETTQVNVDEAKQDAQALVDAGQAKFGTEESKFNTLFCDRSDPQLRNIFDQFATITGKSIEESVKSETKGDFQRGLIGIIRCVRSRPHFFAEQLRKSMKGAGTKESTLNRILITRSEIDLVQIKAAFGRLFNRDLERDVKSETSGDYQKLLIEILKDPSQRTG